MRSLPDACLANKWCEGLLHCDCIDTLQHGPHSKLTCRSKVLNVLIRFVWVIHIPNSSAYSNARNIAAAFLEMLRRVQWNFCEPFFGDSMLKTNADLCADRVESEHIGHADQYRVTRDIPLPYSFDNGPPLDDTDEEIKHASPAAADA